MQRARARHPALPRAASLALLVGVSVFTTIDIGSSAATRSNPARARSNQDEVPGVDRVTAPGRNLSRGLDVLLNGRGREDSGMSRAVYLLIDPTDSVRNAGFAPALAAALDRHADRLAETSLAVVRAGAADEPLLDLTKDHSAVVTAVEHLLQEPDHSYKSLCADLRTLAGAAASVEAVKDVLVVSFDNVDVEDDIEKTGERLRQGGWRCFFITRETPLSDSYWASRSKFSGGTLPPDASMHGSDGPLVDFPFALLFQRSYPNEETPSGFAPWMTSRLAHLTDGTVFLHAPGNSSGHRCSNVGACRFCAGDHRPPKVSFLTQQLSRLAPPVISRQEASARAARDPFFRLVASTWDSAAKDGLMQRTAPFRVRGNSLRTQLSRVPRRLPFAGARSFDSTAHAARETRIDCEKLIKTLAAGIKHHHEANGLPRYRANAEFFLMALRVTRFNLFHLEEFSLEVGTLLTGKVERDFEPPEIAPYQKDQFFKGVQWQDVTLCHGARVLHRLYLPGGDAMTRQIDELDSALTRFQQQYAHSPYAIAASRMEVPIFYTSMGSFGGPPRIRPTSTAHRVDTPPARPKRSSGGSVGRSSGATTGGK